MSLIVKGYGCDDHTPLALGLGPECNEDSKVCAKTSISIENVVKREYSYIPLTGSYSVEEDIGGWQWDKRLLEDRKIFSSLYRTTLGGHKAGLKDGTKIDYWQSGSIVNTEFLSLKEYKGYKDIKTWTPIVRAGKYSIFFEEKNLYSDFSCISRFNLTGSNSEARIHPIRKDAKLDSLSVVMYRRDKSYINWPITFNNVEDFSGRLLESGKRMPVKDAEGKHLWDNLDNRKREYIIEGNEELGYKVILNQDSTKFVGKFPSGELPAPEIMECIFENLNNGNEQGRDCYLQYYPVATSTVRVFEEHGSVEEWKEVKNLNFSDPSDKHFTVDHDLGIVTLGGYKAPDLFLKQPLTPESTEIICYIDDDIFKSYPPQGRITIGSETILYYKKGRNRFYDCVRGHEGTESQTHLIGSKVSDIQHGAGSSTFSTMWLSYKAVPRVEYEVTSYFERTANRSPFIDLKAIRNVVTNNILQISPVSTHVAKLVLETDSPIIGGSLYGPIYYGTDFSRLTARATDSAGNPVEDIEITIVNDSNVGGLNGTFKTYTAISNPLGEIYAIYNAPYDWESIKKDVYGVNHNGADTRFSIEELPPGITPEDIQTYQVLKHDRVLGTVGQRMPVTQYGKNLTIDGNVKGMSWLVVDAVFDDPASQWESEQRRDSPNHPSDEFGIPNELLNNVDAGECHGSDEWPEESSQWGRAWVNVKFVHKVTGNASFVARRIVEAIDYYGDEYALPLIDQYAYIAPCDASPGSNTPKRREKVGTFFYVRGKWPNWLFDANGDMQYDAVAWGLEKDAMVWNGHFLDGVNVVVYEWNDQVLHPITGEVGAYYPLRPDEISSTTLTFKNKQLALPEPFNIENNLGGYLVVSPDVVSLYAHCKDPVSGKVILSNRIKLRLDLPPYLHGVDSTGILPIPYGFGFITEEFNVGTGIGGGNFLTINPRAEGVGAFSLNVNIG